MSQCCGKIPTEEEVGFVVQAALDWIKRYGSIEQGNVGEQIADEYAQRSLHMTPEKFDKRINGFDSVFRENGKLVIVEAKATKASGLASLGQTKHGREGSVEWVRQKAEKMIDPTSSFYSEANEKIGREILRVGPENVSFVVIHTDPTSLKIDVTKIR